MFFENNPEYDFPWLENTVSGYIRKHKISTVFLDYMEVTGGVEKNTKKTPAELLNDLAKFCKNTLAKKGIAVVAFAQANTNMEKKKLSEIDSESIKTSHTMHMKADTVIYMMEGVNEDMKYLNEANPGFNFASEYFNKYTKKGIYGKSMGDTIDPRRIRKLLIGEKNRADTSKRGLCVWCFVEDGNLRWHDLFVTDKNYRLVDIDPVTLPLPKPETDEESETVEAAA